MGNKAAKANNGRIQQEKVKDSPKKVLFLGMYASGKTSVNLKKHTLVKVIRSSSN